jgi:transcriptional regulator with XRE-family HTH domain
VYIHTLNSKAVGNVIAQFRQKKGVSQEVLSGLADIGRTHLSAIERGERKPTMETLYRIANALDVNMSDIIIEIEKEIESQD